GGRLACVAAHQLIAVVRDNHRGITTVFRQVDIELVLVVGVARTLKIRHVTYHAHGIDLGDSGLLCSSSCCCTEEDDSDPVEDLVPSCGHLYFPIVHYITR